MTALLKVRDLQVQYAIRDGGTVQALRGVNFEIQQGEIVGVLGESGCGKTTMARAIAGILSKSAHVTGGNIVFCDQAMHSGPTPKASRDAKAVLISQEPGIVLNPVLRVGDQIAEVVRAHNAWDKARCREEAGKLLRCVQLDADPKLYDAYPHQLSGGQQQRIVIAQALACKPSLLIADEPTAALDDSTAGEILVLLKKAVSERKMALLLITHTPGLLPQIAHRVLVMYAGRVVEDSPVTELFREPLHPYTRALLQCGNVKLARSETKIGSRFSTIDGDVPNLELPISGCSFAARCQQRLGVCTERAPAELLTPAQRKVECFLYAG